MGKCYCRVPSCKNYTGKKDLPYVTWHSFPKNPELRQRWLVNITRDGGETLRTGLTPNSKICSSHFTADDFRPFLNPKIRLLKKDAVPSVFKWTNTEQMSTQELTCSASTRTEENNASSVPVPVIVGESDNPVTYGFGSDSSKLNETEENLNFPSVDVYNNIIQILQAQKGRICNAIEPWFKRRVHTKFNLKLVDTELVLIDKLNGKRILHQDNFPEVFKRCHEDCDHPGLDVTMRNIAKEFANVPRQVVVAYLNQCHTCALRRPLPNPTSQDQFHRKRVMDCVEVDLIDMQSMPDGDYKFIVYIQDNCSKFIWAKALRKQSSLDVAQFVEFVFLYWGEPAVLKSTSSNADVFNGDAFKEMLDNFPRVMHLLQASSLEETGSVTEPGNNPLENMLGSYIQANGQTGWKSALNRIVSEVNRCYSSEQLTSNTPFEIMYGRDFH